jgi:hypothetical protein
MRMRNPPFVSAEHWSLIKRVQRYFSHVCIAFRKSAAHSIVIHFLDLLLPTPFE